MNGINNYSKKKLITFNILLEMTKNQKAVPTCALEDHPDPDKSQARA
jgi:hypothetical protein